MTKPSNLRVMIAFTALTVLAGLTFYPFFMMIVFSLKTNTQFFQQRWLPLPPYHWENYLAAWKIIAVYIKNSIVIAGVNAFFASILASLAAYAFARFRFPGHTLFYYMIIVVIMIPNILYLVPMFVMITQLKLDNTYWGIWGPLVASGQVMMIMILRSFYEQLPEDLFEAARLDGANEFQIMTRIAVPLSLPMVLTVGLLNMQSVWNEFVWPLMVLRDKSSLPVSVGIFYFSSTAGVGAALLRYGEMFAGYAIGSLPLCLLFAFTSKYFIKGLTAGAIKG